MRQIIAIIERFWWANVVILTGFLPHQCSICSISMDEGKKTIDETKQIDRFKQNTVAFVICDFWAIFG